MKKILLSAALLLCTLASQAEAVGDTLVIRDASRVKIETRDTVQRIVISGTHDDPNFHYTQRISIPDTGAVRRQVSNIKDFNKVVTNKKRSKKGVVESSLHLNIGLNTMTGAPGGYGVQLWPSIDYGAAITADWHPFGARNAWSIGFGINWRDYRMAEDKYWVKGADGMMSLADYAADQTDCRSTIHVFSLQIPLMYKHTFDNKGNWRMGLGALLNFNTGGHVTRSYTSGGEDYDVNTYKIGQRPVTVDLMATVDTPWLPGLYVKYSPTSFFRDSRGPKMHQLSFGFCF